MATDDDASSTGDDFDPSPYLPAGCDLVELTREHIQRALDKNHDPTVATVIIGRVNGARVEHLGTFSAAGATLEQLAATYGAGVYEVRYKNPSGAYVGARRIHVGPNGARVGPPPMSGALPPSSQAFPGLGGSGGARGASPLEVLAMRALEQRLFGQQDDPMRGAMAETLKLMAMGAESQRQAAAAAAESQRQFLDMVMKLQTFGREQQPSSDKALELVTKLYLAERARPRDNGNGIAEFVRVFELARTFQAGGPPVPAPDDDEGASSWLKLLAPAIDSMGPPAVSLMAQAFLPAEKAKFVNDTIEAHLRAREAEARADATIETTGEPT